MKRKLPEPTRIDDWRTVYQVAALDDALALIASCHQWMVNVRLDAQIAGDDDRYVADWFRCAVPVARKDAEHFVKDIMTSSAGDPMKRRTGEQLTLHMYIVERIDSNRYKRGTFERLPDRTRRIFWIG